MKHPADCAVEILRVVFRDALEAARVNLHGKGKLVGRVERRAESGELVQQASHSPNVSALIILLRVGLLRSHVEGRADVGVGELRHAFQRSGEPEVAELCVVVAVEEHVGRLDVAVQNGLRRPSPCDGGTS